MFNSWLIHGNLCLSSTYNFHLIAHVINHINKNSENLGSLHVLPRESARVASGVCTCYLGSLHVLPRESANTPTSGVTRKICVSN